MPDSLNLYKLIIETTNEGVWVIDEQNKTSFVNQRMAQMIGYKPEEMLGKSLFDFMDEEGIIISEKNIERRKQGIKELHEFKLQSKTGEDVWTLMNTSPIMENDKYIGALAMVSDITEKKMQEIQIQESYQNYVSLFEESPVAIWEEDFSLIKKHIDTLKKKNKIDDLTSYFQQNPDELKKCASLMKVKNVNQAVVELNEAESKEHVISNFKELISKASPGYTLQEVLAIDNGDRSCSFDTELVTFKGNKRYVHLKWTVVKGHEKDYSKVYLTTTDITKRIIEDNLNLQQSNREKEVLLKEVHHRVKNNLQIISSLLKLQASSIEDPSVRDLFSVSLSRIHSMALVHEHLYRSNIFTKIDYTNYLNALINPLVRLIKGAENRVRVEIKTENIHLNINTSLPLGLLINEIVTNALKHGIKDDAEGLIYIEIAKKGEQDFLLKIGDDGVGMKDLNEHDKDETLGMQLISNLAEQIMGEIQLDHSKKGTHYIIPFKEIP